MSGTVDLWPGSGGFITNAAGILTTAEDQIRFIVNDSPVAYADNTGSFLLSAGAPELDVPLSTAPLAFTLGMLALAGKRRRKVSTEG